MVRACNIMAALLIILAALGCTGPGSAWGQETTVMVDVSVQAPLSIQLTMSPLTINFPNANPDTTPSIGASENPVNVQVNTNAGKKQTVLLTAQAQGDLISGSNTIPISNVRWTATGTGYLGGTMIKNTAVTAFSLVGRGTYNGTFSFFLTNSWNYNVGTYHATVLYTASVP